MAHKQVFDRTYWLLKLWVEMYGEEPSPFDNAFTGFSNEHGGCLTDLVAKVTKIKRANAPAPPF